MAVPDIYSGLSKSTYNRYELAILATWREASQNSLDMDDVPFSKEDIVKHSDNMRKHRITRASLAVKNIPDILYTFRARADLPKEILENGNYAIVGRGKGKYSFVRIPIENRFSFPSKTKVINLSDKTPRWAAAYMNDDEQGMLTRLNINELVSKHLSLKCSFRLQSHLRMGVSNYGQVEVDEIYVGEKQNGERIGIGVEAKDFSDDDRLNISQLFGTAKAINEFFPNVDSKLLGVKPGRNSSILIQEFTTADHPSKICPVGVPAQYKFH